MILSKLADIRSHMKAIRLCVCANEEKGLWICVPALVLCLAFVFILQDLFFVMLSCFLSLYLGLVLCAFVYLVNTIQNE